MRERERQKREKEREKRKKEEREKGEREREREREERGENRLGLSVGALLTWDIPVIYFCRFTQIFAQL